LMIAIDSTSAPTQISVNSYGFHSFSVPSSENDASRFLCGWWRSPMTSLS